MLLTTAEKPNTLLKQHRQTHQDNDLVSLFNQEPEVMVEVTEASTVIHYESSYSNESKHNNSKSIESKLNGSISTTSKGDHE